MAHLPNEIWLQIASYHVVPEMACKHASRQTLIALCLVSKQLCAAVQPLLYQDFTKFARPSAIYRLATQDSEWLHKYYQRDSLTFRTVRKTTRLEKFLRTLINRPDLANEIKYLSIEEFHDNNAIPYWFKELYDKLPLDHTNSILFAHALKNSKAIGRLNHTSQMVWIEHLHDGVEGVEVALLLALVPQLRSLCFQSIETTLGKFVQELCDTLLGPPLRTPLEELSKGPFQVRSQSQKSLEIFPALTSLNLQGRCNKDYRDSLELIQCRNLLSLPTLTRFTGRCLQGSLDPLDSLGRPFPSYPSLAHLRHVELQHCKIEGQGLEAFLGRSNALVSLKIDSDHAFCPWGNLPFISANFFTSLQELTNTLERLTLMIPEYQNTICLDLSGFGKLHYLEVDMSLMIRDDHPSYIAELLPSSIQEVYIRRATQGIIPHVKSLLPFISDPSPLINLYSVRVAVWDKDDDDFLSELVDIEEQAADHMFDFEIDVESISSHWWAHHYDTDSDLGSELDSENETRGYYHDSDASQLDEDERDDN
ncbi:hypothetical protein E4T39_07543 [Aureobasidium subglaciale]|nr:hypothetical protein E4T39_07543 [Aureobasidium subglaciale]